MKNSLESLRAEAEKQQARADGLAEQVAALTEQVNNQSGHIVELNDRIKHIKLMEAGKRGSLMKRYNTLLTEYQDLADQLTLMEERCAAMQKENIESKLLVNKLQRSIKKRDDYIEKFIAKLMSRNLWQRIINKPVTISGETETTEDHEQKPEISTPAEQ